MAVLVDSKCVLLFSGGRDSTIAALRLLRSGCLPALVTVTTEHLVGVEVVRDRLRELSRLLPPETSWFHVTASEEAHGVFLSAVPSCLPCHQIYTLIGVRVADTLQTKNVAFGYSGYQSEWAEQTPAAIHTLEAVLRGHGFNLVLPVYDVQSKEAAIAELADQRLSVGALEQKCLRQQYNLKLDAETINEQVATWKDALNKALSLRDQFQIRIQTQLELRELQDFHADRRSI